MWFRQDILNLDAYQTHAITDNCIKLDAMENPYTLPSALKREYLDTLAKVDINRYPDSDANALKRQLRRAMAIHDTHDILLGNGSDELIQLLMLACAPNDVINEFYPKFCHVRYGGAHDWFTTHYHPINR